MLKKKADKRGYLGPVVAGCAALAIAGAFFAVAAGMGATAVRSDELLPLPDDVAMAPSVPHDGDGSSVESETPAAPERDTVVTAAGDECASGELLVGYDGSLDEDSLVEAAGSCGLTVTSVDVLIADTGDGSALAVVGYEGDMLPDAAADAVSANGSVVFAEPNYVLSAAEDDPAPAEDATQPADDPDHVSNDEYVGYLWEQNASGFRSAWDVSRCNGSVTVAVIDTGANYNHPDLRGNLVSGSYAKNTYTGATGESAVADQHGHGTHVSGTVAAVADNGIGTAGVSYNAKVLPIKASFDWTGDMYTDDLVEGIFYAAAVKTNPDSPDEMRNIRVINISSGSYQYSNSYQAAITYATRCGILVVASAGNDSTSSAYWPAAYDNVVAVSACMPDQSGGAVFDSSYSNFGGYVDIAAPGTNICSTIKDGTYGFMSGTSMAAPMVSGAAALVFSTAPLLKPAQVEQILQSTAVDKGAAGYDQYYGYGVLNADGAVREAKRIADRMDAVDRIAGNYANQTSAMISEQAFPNGSEWVVIARDDDFADAMSATGLAGALRCPIVLTGRNSLSAAAAEEIVRLGATKAYVIGGKGAIPADLESQLGELGCQVVQRVYGQYAYDTSVECAKLIQAHGGGTWHAIVAMGTNFQDALSISSFAYINKIPIFLTMPWEGRELPDSAIRFIDGMSGAIWVPGGPGAVPEASVEGVFEGRRIQRLYGYDGYETSNVIAHFMTENGYLMPNVCVVACGAQGPKGADALAGSALAGMSMAPILLVNGNDRLGGCDYTVVDEGSASYSGYIEANAASVNQVWVLGGAYVMPEAAVNRIASVLAGL